MSEDTLKHAQALAAVSRRLWQRGFVEATSGNFSVPVVDNDQDMERMSRACAAAIRPPAPAVVLRGHGVTVFGADLSEAVRHLEALEALAHLVILQRSLGVKPWRS